MYLLQFDIFPLPNFKKKVLSAYVLQLLLLQELEASIRPDTALVSIMTVNNEIGVKQPVHEIGHLTLHTPFYICILGQKSGILCICHHYPATHTAAAA